MTKKHFIELAQTVQEIENQIIRQHRTREIPLTPEWVCSLLEEELSLFCRSQNSAFKKDRWIDYVQGKCGPSGGKR